MPVDRDAAEIMLLECEAKFEVIGNEHKARLRFRRNLGADAVAWKNHDPGHLLVPSSFKTTKKNPPLGGSGGFLSLALGAFNQNRSPLPLGIR